MTPRLFWRTFTRDGSEDIDTLADSEFLKTNFTDFFGQWLQQGNNASIESFDGLLMTFWGNKAAYTVKTFMVADGGFLNRKDHPDWDWFSPHLRLVTIVTPATSSAFTSSTSDWTLCIVGGSDLKNSDRNQSFLQVASWNGVTFRFYQNDIIIPGGNGQAWNYFGQSMDAFGANAYLGPFNGHVNGACIMKEIHKPWIHWLGSSGSFIASLTDQQIEQLSKAPYITQPGQKPLSAVNRNPNDLELMIKAGVGQWFSSRRRSDFLDAQNQLRTSPDNISRWASHLFLTTTINIAAGVETADGGIQIPPDHFYDNELLSLTSFGTLLPPNITTSVTFTWAQYETAATALGLCLLEQIDTSMFPNVTPDLYLPADALGGDTRLQPEPSSSGNDLAFKITVQNGEGEAPFNILQASLEDAVGVQTMQSLRKNKPPPGKIVPTTFMGLFTEATLNAVLMVDFWNPVYSWRRGVLMQYIPQATTLDGQAQVYDLDARFIANVKRSPWVMNNIVDSPEYQFVKLLTTPLDQHQAVITAYFQAIQDRMKADGAKALQDYLFLAESRRRVYRPLPLDEFDSTLPYATKVPFNSPFMEMTRTGEIQTMPARGQKFLKDWITSLASVDPHVVPAAVNNKPTAPIALAALPGPAGLSMPCQTPTQGSRALYGSIQKNTGGRRGRSCPYFARRKQATMAVAKESSLMSTQGMSKTPTWTEDILPLIKSPYWVSGDASIKGAGWIGAMEHWMGWRLDDIAEVKKRAEGVYQHLRSKSMPITEDPQDYWPEEALETFRNWANAGFPQSDADAPVPNMIIPKPLDPAPTFRIRRDIMTLSKEELAVYQSKLDDVLQVSILGSKWQELGFLHAEWCLHYQEATFFWHRAYLRYVETLIDHPIPYWNGFAASSSDPDSQFAGIPPMFLEDTYIHPKDGSVRPNPLKYALALDGKSRDPKGGQYVTRDKVLVQGKSSPDWKAKIGLFKLYHDQILLSLQQSTYTSPETAESFGVPWANISTFSENQPDSLYPYRLDFDGLFEQVHDNFHGWVGPDMADNSYTAFDPIFLSYHANMDRLAGFFMDAHPGAQYTSAFPLQPFMDNGGAVRYDDPRRWAYTTIGDMAKDTRALGYLYGVPANADAHTPLPLEKKRMRVGLQASGGRAISLPAAVSNGDVAKIRASETKVPYVVFEDVGCTIASFTVDVYSGSVDSKNKGAPDIHDPGFIGRVTRIGMGTGREGMGLRNSGRCRRPQASRLLCAEKLADNLAAGEKVSIVVTDLGTGKRLSPGEYQKMPGFEPQVLWLPKRVEQ